MGENLVLIQGIEGIQESKGGWKEWEKFWFSWVRPWKPEDVCLRRSVWTVWYGVPLHAWSERLFRQMSLRFGSFQEWDEVSRKKQRLDAAKVKIWGRASQLINEIITVSIEGNEFAIRITEEKPLMEEGGEDDSDSLSAFSEVAPGKAMWAGDGSESETSKKGGEENPEAMISNIRHAALQRGGGAMTEKRVLESGRVGSSYEENRKSGGIGGVRFRWGHQQNGRFGRSEGGSPN